MIYNNITEYLQAKTAWQQQPVSIQGGIVHVNGNAYQPAEFYAANPKPRYEAAIDKSNPDKTVIAHGCKTKHK